jgi:hypothetical protein
MSGGASGLIGLVILVIAIVAYWRIFTKAGEAGWKAIIPIYNTIVLLKIVGRPWWWLLLMLIPLVNIIVFIVVMNDLSKSFGHGMGFTLGLIFLSFIFYLILAFGSSQYRGPAGARAHMGGTPAVAAVCVGPHERVCEEKAACGRPSCVRVATCLLVFPPCFHPHRTRDIIARLTQRSVSESKMTSNGARSARQEGCRGLLCFRRAN